MAMQRNSIVPIEDVLPFVGKGIKKINGVPIKMGSPRYRLFKEKGTTCVVCGLKGKYFAIERSYKEGEPATIGWHLNLYAVNDEGEEILMTKDHIHPKSKGGKNHHDNYQTMCAVCNHAKADNV